MIIVYDTTVGTDRNIDSGLLKILISRGRYFDDRRSLSAADSLCLSCDTDGTAADTDLDKVRARFRQETEPFAVDDIAAADFRIFTESLFDITDRLSPEFGETY